MTMASSLSKTSLVMISRSPGSVQLTPPKLTWKRTWRTLLSSRSGRKEEGEESVPGNPTCLLTTSKMKTQTPGRWMISRKISTRLVVMLKQTLKTSTSPLSRRARDTRRRGRGGVKREEWTLTREDSVSTTKTFSTFPKTSRGRGALTLAQAASGPSSTSISWPSTSCVTPTPTP